MNKIDKVNFIKKIVSENAITAYTIHRGTGLAINGVTKILDGTSKSPQDKSLNLILDFLEEYLTSHNLNTTISAKEPAQDYGSPCEELIEAYKKQIALHEKNAELYEENYKLMKEKMSKLDAK